MAQEDRHLFWNRENDVPEEVITYVDGNVLARLPPGTIIKGIFPHGASYWTRTAEIETEQADGEEKSFFIKVAKGDTGKAMVFGEFTSMTLLHQAIPDATPNPIAVGTYSELPSCHFFLCEFIDMMDEVPDIHSFVKAVAELHAKGTSPNGKYGFPVPTYLGNMPQYIDWTDTWEEFFTNSIKRNYEYIEASQPGSLDTEFSNLLEQIYAKVIPRLLRPLETGGRTIRPSLVHGDLYSGNVSVGGSTNAPVLYDATSLYAHNEWDLAPWGLARHKISRPFLRAYCTYFPVSVPEEDHEDRNKLYCLRWDMKGMAIYPGDVRYRNYCIDAMRLLVEKYPDGYEGWAEAMGEVPAPDPRVRPKQSDIAASEAKAKSPASVPKTGDHFEIETRAAEFVAPKETTSVDAPAHTDKRPGTVAV